MDEQIVILNLKKQKFTKSNLNTYGNVVDAKLISKNLLAQFLMSFGTR